MAACFTEWTVLPHQPMQKLAPNVWAVSGSMPSGSDRHMTLVRLHDGRLVVHNAIALDEPEMAEVDAFGKIAAILVPSGFHRQDARIWKDRYPEAKVYCPRKAKAKVSKVVEVDGDYESAPQDDSVRIAHIAGLKESEGYVRVRSDKGTTLVFNDIVVNMPRLKGLMGWAMAPTGRPSMPRLVRLLLLEDKRALGKQLAELAKEPALVRIIVGHGTSIDERPREVLEALVSEFCG